MSFIKKLLNKNKSIQQAAFLAAVLICAGVDLVQAQASSTLLACMEKPGQYFCNNEREGSGYCCPSDSSDSNCKDGENGLQCTVGDTSIIGEPMYKTYWVGMTAELCGGTASRDLIAQPDKNEQKIPKLVIDENRQAQDYEACYWTISVEDNKYRDDTGAYIELFFDKLDKSIAYIYDGSDRRNFTDFIETNGTVVPGVPYRAPISSKLIVVMTTKPDSLGASGSFSYQLFDYTEYWWIEKPFLGQDRSIWYLTLVAVLLSPCFLLFLGVYCCKHCCCNKSSKEKKPFKLNTVVVDGVQSPKSKGIHVEFARVNALNNMLDDLSKSSVGNENNSDVGTHAQFNPAKIQPAHQESSADLVSSKSFNASEKPKENDNYDQREIVLVTGRRSIRQRQAQPDREPSESFEQSVTVVDQSQNNQSVMTKNNNNIPRYTGYSLKPVQVNLSTQMQEVEPPENHGVLGGVSQSHRDAPVTFYRFTKHRQEKIKKDMYQDPFHHSNPLDGLDDEDGAGTVDNYPRTSRLDNPRQRTARKQSDNENQRYL